jgi:segregation and condensation protein A
MVVERAVAIGPGLAAADEVAVEFGAGRRPDVATHVRLAEFEGPLGLLLSLIEAQKLDVLTVPLGALAGAYLEALAGLDGDRLGNVSVFVAVAGQLILIKSRALLPRHQPADPLVDPDAETPDPEAELRLRLLVYRAFRDAGAALQLQAGLAYGLFRREPSAAAAAALAGARPAEEPALDSSILAAALTDLIRIVPEPEPPPEVLGRTITIGERAEVIRAALRQAGSVVLQEILLGVTDRVVIAVTFLALLELVKRREVLVEQAEPWGPIVATSMEPSA